MTVKNITFKRLIGKTVILNGFMQGKIVRHTICEHRDGSLEEDIYVSVGDYEFYVDLKDVILLDKNVTFVNKDNVIFAILNVKNQTKVGYTIYKNGDEYDLAFGRALAIYRALVDKDISADDFADIRDEYFDYWEDDEEDEEEEEEDDWEDEDDEDEDEYEEDEDNEEEEDEDNEEDEDDWEDDEDEDDETSIQSKTFLKKVKNLLTKRKKCRIIYM